MPDRNSEYKWEALNRVLDPHTLPAFRAAKVGAAMKFHQHVLHATEQHVTDEKLNQMEVETFSLLTDEEKQKLTEAHHFLIPHYY